MQRLSSGRRLVNRLGWFAAALVTASIVFPPASNAQQAGRYGCQGVYLGTAISGFLEIQRHGTRGDRRIYGYFRSMSAEARVNVVELEVVTPGEVGIGAFWTNGARHRPMGVRLKLYRGGFVIETETGFTGQFNCG